MEEGFGFADIGWISVGSFPAWPCRKAEIFEAGSRIGYKTSKEQILVQFFGTHIYAWVLPDQVKLWNIDLDDNAKTSKLHSYALEEAYTWQIKTITKKGRRRGLQHAMQISSDLKEEYNTFKLGLSKLTEIDLSDGESEVAAVVGDKGAHSGFLDNNKSKSHRADTRNRYDDTYSKNDPYHAEMVQLEKVPVRSGAIEGHTDGHLQNENSSDRGSNPPIFCSTFSTVADRLLSKRRHLLSNRAKNFRRNRWRVDGFAFGVSGFANGVSNENSSKSKNRYHNLFDNRKKTTVDAYMLLMVENHLRCLDAVIPAFKCSYINSCTKSFHFELDLKDHIQKDHMDPMKIFNFGANKNSSRVAKLVSNIRHGKIGKKALKKYLHELDGSSIGVGASHMIDEVDKDLVFGREGLKVGGDDAALRGRLDGQNGERGASTEKFLFKTNFFSIGNDFCADMTRERGIYFDAYNTASGGGSVIGESDSNSDTLRNNSVVIEEGVKDIFMGNEIYGTNALLDLVDLCTSQNID